MSLEIHNQTLYRGMSDMMYRTIDREVRAALVLVYSTIYPPVLSFKRKGTYILVLMMRPTIAQNIFHTYILTPPRPQATYRVSSVLGPHCWNASDPCRRLLQLSAGRLLHDIRGALEGAICDGTEDAKCPETAASKLRMYSAHDSTLMTLMAGEAGENTEG